MKLKLATEGQHGSRRRRRLEIGRKRRTIGRWLGRGSDVLAGFLRRRHKARERVQRDARDLLTFMGDGAYGEARTRAREHRDKGDGGGDRHWGKVAVEIARSTGYVVGEKAADRYVQTAEPERPQPNRRAIIAELLEISEAIRDLSRGATDSMSLHNAEAAVHRLVGLQGSHEAEVAGAELRRALNDLAASQGLTTFALQNGVYPPQTEAAGKKLERLRGIVLPAR